MSSAINALLTAGVGEGLFDIVTRQAHAEIAGYYADTEEAEQHQNTGAHKEKRRLPVITQLLATAGRRQGLHGDTGISAEIVERNAFLLRMALRVVRQHPHQCALAENKGQPNARHRSENELMGMGRCDVDQQPDIVFTAEGEDALDVIERGERVVCRRQFRRVSRRYAPLQLAEIVARTHQFEAFRRLMKEDIAEALAVDGEPLGARVVLRTQRGHALGHRVDAGQQLKIGKIEPYLRYKRAIVQQTLRV